jgi:hypothetical protein
VLTRSPRSSVRVFKLVLVAGSMALALGVTEGFLRTFMPVRGMIYALDDRYLFRHIPGARKVGAAAGEPWSKVLVRINAAGRRGDESMLPRAVHRVVVYGDSFVSAEATPEPETFAAQLARLLSEPTRPTVVLNAGVTGYGIDQESLLIEDELPSLKADLVIVAAYAGNDFGDLLRNKLYRLDGEGRLAANVPTIDDALRQAFLAPFKMSSIQIVRALQSAADGWSRRPSSAASPSAPQDPMATRLANRRAEYEDYILRGDNVVRNLLADQYDADVSLDPDSASAHYRVRLMARVLERIHQLTARGGASLLVVIIPERCDVAGDCAVTQSRQRYPGYRPTGLTDALDSIARDQGIARLNLFESFHAAGAASLYHPRDEHWNAAGQLLAARVVAGMIVSARLLRPEPDSGSGGR